jgi:hypothetical protein
VYIVQCTVYNLRPEPEQHHDVGLGSDSGCVTSKLKRIANKKLRIEAASLSSSSTTELPTFLNLKKPTYIVLQGQSW